VLFRKDVEKENLGVYLVSLCKYFYEQQNEVDTVLHHIYRDEEVKAKEEANKIITVYQCRHCLSIYDENYGDESNNISPQTSFAALAATYECPICNAPKEDFMPMEKDSNLYAQITL
jgi:rubredoxin